jgi:NAD(P)H-dependent nitrite reductase small subunit
VFNFAFRGEWYASQDVCPHRRDAVLSRGIVGDQGGTPKVACPLHKKTFSLRTGECLSGEEYRVQTFPVKIEDGAVFLELPPVAQVEEQLNANGKSCESSACVAQVSPNS